jgi:Restriction endonuclease
VADSVTTTSIAYPATRDKNMLEQGSAAVGSKAQWMTDALRRINDMPDNLFEQLIITLLRATGYTRISIAHTDQGRTVAGSAVRSQLADDELFFQFSRGTSNVGVKALRDFNEATISHKAHGMLVTTASFTRKARAVLDGLATSQISLIDGKAFCELLRKHDVGLQSKVLRIEEVKFDPTFFMRSDRQILEILRTSTLRARTIGIFPMGYLTIIAIIQGVALGIVLNAAVHYMTARHSDVPVYLCHVPPLVISCFNLWWLSTIALMFLGGCAFCYTAFRSSRAMFDRENVHAGLLKLLCTLIVICFSTSLYGIIAYSIWVGPHASTLARSSLALSIAVVAGFIVGVSEKGLAAFYRQYDLPRR